MTQNRHYLTSNVSNGNAINTSHFGHTFCFSSALHSLACFKFVFVLLIAAFCQVLHFCSHHNQYPCIIRCLLHGLLSACPNCIATHIFCNCIRVMR